MFAFLSGCALVVAGVAAVSVPAAVVLCGVALAAAALLVDDGGAA